MKWTMKWKEKEENSYPTKKYHCMDNTIIIIHNNNNNNDNELWYNIIINNEISTQNSFSL